MLFQLFRTLKTECFQIRVVGSGSFGKLFSEAMENADDRQMEGVASTGAGPVLAASGIVEVSTRIPSPLSASPSRGRGS